MTLRFRLDGVQKKRMLNEELPQVFAVFTVVFECGVMFAEMLGDGFIASTRKRQSKKIVSRGKEGEQWWCEQNRHRLRRTKRETQLLFGVARRDRECHAFHIRPGWLHCRGCNPLVSHADGIRAAESRSTLRVPAFYANLSFVCLDAPPHPNTDAILRFSKCGRHDWGRPSLCGL